jgi:peptidyl-prolyl cis-trans isomerase D
MSCLNRSDTVTSNPSTEEIAAYFDAKKTNTKPTRWSRPGTWCLTRIAYKGEVTIDEDEIMDYYDSNITEFKTEKTVEARHILIKLDAVADEDADLAAKPRAEES